MGSPEKPLDVEMGDMSPDGNLKQPEVDIKPDQTLLEKNGEVKEPERFTGLNKEELLEISKQPNWVRARWALFIIFWIIWVAMLVGAILIVVNAPRCKPEPVPQWYKDDVVYEVQPKQFADGFKGMKDHLSYIRSKLHSKIILLTGVTSKEDITASVMYSQNESLVDLVEAIHDGKGKVIIDMVVDSLPISSREFICSAKANCSACKFCNMFIWKNGTAATADQDWKFSETRQELYKVSDTGDALIDYSTPESFSFIQQAIQSWFDNHTIDGVKIRDLSKVQNIPSKEFVEKLWNSLFTNNKTNRALYVYSSTPDASENPVSLGANQTNTEHSPVYLTSDLVNVVNQSEAGKMIEDKVNLWRSQSRSVGGFVVSPLNDGLAAARFPLFAAGLNILAMALPGLPILRSGDELAAVSPYLTWTEAKDLRDSYPLNGSMEILGQTSELIVKIVAGIQAKQSLRYDTRDNDTSFNFLSTSTNDVVAFTRKWDKKSALLVVSNMSPTNHTLNLKVENGLKSKNELAETAKVLVKSNPDFKEETIKLGSVEMWSGLTLVLETSK